MVGRKGYNAIPAGGHPAIDSEGSCHIAGQVSVVAVKALSVFTCLRHESLHLHICGSHQRTRHPLQVDALVTLVDVIGIYICDLAVRERKTRLDLQRPFQLLWQRFAPFKRPAQYPHASLR